MSSRSIVLLACLGSLIPIPARAQTAPAEGIRTGEPVKILHVNPVYPQIAQSARVSGRVVGEVEVAPDGTVVAARVLCSIPLLDQALLDAVRQWRYRPERRPAAVRAIVSASFTLDSDDGSRSSRYRCSPVDPPGTPTRVAQARLTRTQGGDPLPTPEELRLAAAFARKNDLLVIADVLIAPEGYVYGARIITSPPYLEQAVLDAVHEWSFDPLTVDGKPVAAGVNWILKFQGDAPPAAPTAKADASELAAIKDGSLKAHRVGGTIRSPVKVKTVLPVYPPIAMSAKIEGRVILDLTVGRSGRVLEARPLGTAELNSSKLFSAPLLYDAAVAAARQWRYEPVTVNGEVVPTIVPGVVEFALADRRIRPLGIFEDTVTPPTRRTQQARFDDVVLNAGLAQSETSAQLTQSGAAVGSPRYAAVTSWVDERLVLASLVKPRGTPTIEFFCYTMLPIAKRALLAGLLLEREATTTRRWNGDLIGALEAVRPEYDRILAEYGGARLDAALDAVRGRLRPSFMGRYLDPERQGDSVYRLFLRHLDPSRAESVAEAPPSTPSRRGMPAPPERAVEPAIVPRVVLASPTEGELVGLDVGRRVLTLKLKDGSVTTFGFDDTTTVSAMDGNARLLVRSEGRALDSVRTIRLQWSADPGNPSQRLIGRVTVTSMR